MKRKRRPPLFRNVGPTIYLIDTSAWLNIERRPDAEAVWQLVSNLIADDRIVACAQVLGELRDDPVYLSRLKQHENALRAGDHKSDDPEYLMHVGKIAHQHPGMSRAVGKRTPADPYVVALAEREGYVVVCDESTKRANRKMSGVCQQRNIACLTLAQFIAKEKN